MRHNRRAARVLAGTVLVAVAAFVSAPPGSADPGDGNNSLSQQLAQAQDTYEAATAQAQAAIAAYNAATAQLPGATARLADAKGVVAARTVQADEANRALDAARVAQAGAQTRLAGAAKRVDQARDQVSAFVAAAYRGSGMLALSSLLESRSPEELADRIGYLDKVAESQRRALDGYEVARLTGKEAANQAQVAADAADAASTAASTALNSAIAAQTQAQQAQSKVTALIAQQAQAMATANAQRDATLERYRELREESDRVAAQLRGWGSRDGASGGWVPVLHPGAYFLTPVHGWKSSDFGERWDPYYHVWQLHAGVDLAAPEGTPIYAAADGTVARAGWDGGYGNYTCIYHGLYQGQGLSTCYGHQSAILVDVGQRVHRGQVIGRVGTTGASTGDHLHFEVRVNGTPVQPLNWLSACLC